MSKHDIKMTWPEYDEYTENCKVSGECRLKRRIKNAIKNAFLLLLLVLIVVFLILAILWLWRALF